MENETPEFETPSAPNKDMWLFLIVLDVIILCVLGFFLYNHFSSRVLNPASPNTTAVPVKTLETVPVTSVAAEPGKDSPDVSAKYKEGMDAFNRGNWEAAQALFVEAQQLDPAREDIQTALAQTEEMLAKAAQPVTVPEEKQMVAEIVQENIFPTVLTEDSQEEAASQTPVQRQSIVVAPVTGSKYRRVTFRWFEPAEQVSIVSGFTNRKPQALKKTGDYWETTLTIAPGTYKFLYIIDGKNTLDPYADQKDGRSVLIVK